MRQLDKPILRLWVTLTEPLDSVDLLPRAVADKVAYVPGPSFFPAGREEARRHLRLNFSYCGPERIEKSIRRLGAVFARAYCAHFQARRTVK